MTDDYPIHVPDLSIEPTGGELWLLTQDDGAGNIGRVALHPVHVRLLVDEMGLTPTSDPAAAKAIAMLVRRMRVLHDRIAHLDHWLHSFSDSQHADLSYEQTYSSATLDVADEFIAGLSDLMPGAPDGQPLDSSCASDGKTPGIAMAIATPAPAQQELPV